MRHAIVHFIAMVMLAVYGAQVCPMIEQLAFLELAIVIAIAAVASLSPIQTIRVTAACSLCATLD